MSSDVSDIGYPLAEPGGRHGAPLRYKKLEKARSPQGPQAVVCLQRKGNVYHGPATGSPRPDPWADMRRSITV